MKNRIHSARHILFTLAFGASLLFSAFSHADCVYIAANAAQRQVFSHFGYIPGFQSGCLVVQQDTSAVYVWNGSSYSAVGGSSGLTTLNAQTGATQVFANDTNIIITSSNNTHSLGFAGTLGLSRGGTGASVTAKAGGVVYGASTSAMNMTVAGTSGQVLTSQGASAPTWTTVAATPGGSNTQMQFNNSSSFAGTTGLTYDNGNSLMRGTSAQYGTIWVTNYIPPIDQSTPQLNFSYYIPGDYSFISSAQLDTIRKPLYFYASEIDMASDSNVNSGIVAAKFIGTQLDMLNHNIINVATPVSAADGAPKSYVDSSVNTYAARAYSSATSISGSLATIVYATESYDASSSYDNTTGIYTAPIAGQYHVNAALLITGTIALNNTLIMEIQVNGTVWARKTIFLAAGLTDGKIDITDDVQLGATDTVQIQVSSSATSPSIVSSNFDNYLSIARIP